jgi:phage shock protein E
MQNVFETIKQKQGTLLDVRSPLEFESEHVPGAINIPLDTIESNIKKITSLPKPILIYCLSGGRSGVATSILQQNGIAETYNGGGIYNLLSILNNN